MQVIARRTLKEFWERHPQAEGPIRAWFALAVRRAGQGPNEIKRQFGTSVDFVGDNRVIFDLGGNKYRLIVHVSYQVRPRAREIHRHPCGIRPHRSGDRVMAKMKSTDEQALSGRSASKPITRRRSTRSSATSTGSRSPALRRRTASICSLSSSRTTRDKRWPIEPPDPIEAIRWRMETGRLYSSRSRSSDRLAPARVRHSLAQAQPDHADGVEAPP